MIPVFEEEFELDASFAARARGLCLRNTIPKWAHKWHRDSWAGKIKGFYPSVGLIEVKQDSNKHYLMCGRCELFASRSEQYVQALVSGSWDEKLRHKILELPYGWFLRIDTRRISKFVSITALRCHYAPSPPFHKLEIPLDLRGRLRRKIFGLLTDRERPWIGGVRFFPPPSSPHHDPRCDIRAQYELNDSLGPLFAALIGGWEWYIWFEPKKRSLARLSMRRCWFVRVGSISFEEHRSVKRMSEALDPYKEKFQTTRARSGLTG